MDELSGCGVWEAYAPGPSPQELAYQDEGFVPIFTQQSPTDIHQYVRVVDTAYISRGSNQSQDGSTAGSWGEGWQSWNKFDPSIRSSMPTTFSRGTLTPGLTTFDETRTVNPDSLIKAESNFGNPWSFSPLKTRHETSLPISPTSPSRATFHTPCTPYDGPPNGYLDIPSNISQSAQSETSSLVSPVGIEESMTPNQVDSQDYFNASILPIQTKNLSASNKSPQIHRKRGSKSENPAQAKRRRSKTVATSKHNQIEKRYRTNLNEKITALRDSVPSLRALMDGDPDDGRVSGDEESDDDARAAAAAQRRRSIAKAEVLSKATEYIHDLEKTVKQMEMENKALQARVVASECPKVEKRVRKEAPS